MSSIVLQMRALSPKYVGNFFQGWHLISERYISLFWKHAVWSFVKKLNRHQRKVNDENDVNVALVGVAINVDSNDTWTTPKTFFLSDSLHLFPHVFTMSDLPHVTFENQCSFWLEDWTPSPSLSSLPSLLSLTFSPSLTVFFSKTSQSRASQTIRHRLGFLSNHI